MLFNETDRKLTPDYSFMFVFIDEFTLKWLHPVLKFIRIMDKYLPKELNRGAKEENIKPAHLLKLPDRAPGAGFG